MVALFIFLSFVLHAVTLYFLVILFKKYAAIKHIELSQRKLLEDAEATISSFILEIKEENERFTKKLKNPLPEKKEFKPEVKYTESIPEKSLDIPEHLNNLLNMEDVIELSTPNTKEEIPQTFEQQVIKLYEQGHSVEEIAKKMSSGKTEIELVLKFRQN